jgi:hypothetical protein
MSMLALPALMLTTLLLLQQHRMQLTLVLLLPRMQLLLLRMQLLLLTSCLRLGTIDNINYAN